MSTAMPAESNSTTTEPFDPFTISDIDATRAYADTLGIICDEGPIDDTRLASSMNQRGYGYGQRGLTTWLRELRAAGYIRQRAGEWEATPKGIARP